MTIERAIQILKMNEQAKWRSGITYEEEKEAVDMAIEALIIDIDLNDAYELGYACGWKERFGEPKDQVEKVIAVTKSFLKDIDEQPTIEARPSGECKIYHARFEDRIACKCGFMQVITGHWDDYNYCQRCGRKALKEGEANEIQSN